MAAATQGRRSSAAPSVPSGAAAGLVAVVCGM